MRDDAVTETEQDSAGVIGPPPLIYFGPLMLGLLMQRVRPVTALPRGVARPLGRLLLAIGIPLNLWTLLTFRREHTPLDPRKPVAHIITSGPFRYSRNPSYTAFALIYLGVAVLRNTLWPLLWLPAVLLTMRRGVIAREELYLERKFGDEYRQYKSRVRRWL